jgi:hypothetical protein
MDTWKKWTWACIAVLPIAAQAQSRLDLTTLDRNMSGTRAQVLVLGTMHLRSMPPDFNPAVLDKVLDKVLDRLAAFKPDIVTIETESGEECDLAARHPAKYGVDYCPSTAVAQAATGLDVPGAIAQVDKTLKAWPAHATSADRRRLAALFMAANDQASAYVQWLQLTDSEQRAEGQLNTALVDMLR